MLLFFTDVTTGLPVAINPQHVACVFTTKDESGAETTIINLVNGNVAVSDSQLEVVGRIQGELK